MKYVLILSIFVVSLFTLVERLFAADIFPLIIMGGRWAAFEKEGYSDLSRVCDVGFTHVSSYQNESKIESNIELKKMVGKVEKFAKTIKDNCPKMGLVVGIPRRWIYENKKKQIITYIKEIKALNISVDYWYSDEMIHQMIKRGLNLDEAIFRAISAIQAVRSLSGSPYIWIEPGNYNKLTNSILERLSKFKGVVKSFDEYVISRHNELTISGLNGILDTMKILKANGIEQVFPVVEMNLVKGRTPNKSELATIIFSLIADGADGILFYEERRTTSKVLENIKDITSVTKLITAENDFDKISSETVTIWESKSDNGTTEIILNNQEKKINIQNIIGEGITPVWPDANSDQWTSLNPLNVLLFNKAPESQYLEDVKDKASGMIP